MNQPLPVTQIQDALRFVQLPIGQVVADPMQVRREFDEEFIAQLAESIKAHGILQPLVVHPIAEGGYEIIAGENRFRAARKAGLTEIPVIVRNNLSADDISVIQLLENLQRKDLSLADTVAGVTQLVDKIGTDKASQQLGMSKAWVSKHSRVKDLPKPIREAVVTGRLLDLEVAHDLGKIMELDAEEADGYLEYLSASDEEREDIGVWKRPTRERVREKLQDIKGWIEDEQQRTQQEAVAQEDPAAIKRDKDIKAQQKREADRITRVNELNKACKKFSDDMELTIAEALGLKLPASDLSVNPDWFNAYSGAVPKSIESAGFKVSLAGGIARMNAMAKALGYPAALGITVEIEPLTLARAEKLAEALNHQGVVFDIHSNTTGQGLHDLVSRMKNTATPPKAAKASPAGAVGSVAKFISARLDKRDKSAQIKASDVYAAYEDWCEENDFVAIAFTNNAWGEAIAKAGIDKKRSNGIQYIGCKLKATNR